MHGTTGCSWQRGIFTGGSSATCCAGSGRCPCREDRATGWPKIWGRKGVERGTVGKMFLETGSAVESGPR
jgi:hypothetical protein